MLPAVTDLIATRSDPEKLATMQLVDGLLQHPRARSLGVTPVKGIRQKSVYTAPFGPGAGEYGHLDFEIWLDHPVVHIFRIVFWVPYASAGPIAN